MPQKITAFQQMTWRYRNPKQIAEFTRLIEEHAKHHPDDPRLLLERAELHLLRGEMVQAEPILLRAKEKATPADVHSVRVALMRCRVRMGKAVETYQEYGPGAMTFQDLAFQCAFEKNPQQLEALLAAHRQAFPKFKNTAVWEVEIGWLKKDYENTARVIQAQRAALLENQTHRWKCEGYLIRSLVRLKRNKEAVEEAEILGQKKTGSHLLQALAFAAAGDEPRTLAFLDKVKSPHYLIEDCYFDEDLGPILRSDAFRKFRERYPEPPPRPGSVLPEMRP